MQIHPPLRTERCKNKVLFLGRILQIPAAYPASAGLICNDGWDVCITGNYLYWKPNLNSDFLGVLVDQTANATNGLNGISEYVFLNPGYTSGFQVGLELSALDNWDDKATIFL